MMQMINTLVEFLRRHRLGLMLAGALLALTVVYLHDPNRPGNYPACPFRLLTGGRYCPGCGSLRCLHAVLHGRLRQALAYNPITLFTLPALALWFAGEAWREKFQRALFPRLPGWVIMGYAGLLIVFWILRNFETWPFRLLAPHRIY